MTMPASTEARPTAAPGGRRAMSDFPLALPEPGAVSTAQMAEACRSIYESRDVLIGGLPLEAAREWQRRSQAIEEYLRGTEAYPEAQRAGRVLEMAVGSALGKPQRGKKLSPAGDNFQRNLRHEFRALHAGRAKIEPYLDGEAPTVLPDGQPKPPGLSRETALRIARGATPRSEARRRLPGPLPDLPDKRYGLIYADPPWPMPDWIESRDLTRHYPVKSIDDLMAWPVADIAADDAVLYLWAISTHLHDAFHVIEAWGFEYVTNMVWVKPRIGTGWWVRHQHELLLIARRGHVSPPAPDVLRSSVINAPVGATARSRKASPR